VSETNKVEKRDFLVEIGTEELPPKALRELESAFVAGRAVRALGGRAGPRCRSRLRGPALRKRQKRGHQVDVVVSL